jgi:hypothetical protein
MKGGKAGRKKGGAGQRTAGKGARTGGGAKRGAKPWDPAAKKPVKKTTKLGARRVEDDD